MDTLQGPLASTIGGRQRHRTLTFLLAVAVGLPFLNLPPGAGGVHPLRAQDAPAEAAAVPANPGPVRMSRFTIVEGNVSWRADAGGDWAAAVVNLPVRQGAQIWSSDRSRAEIQFDDGSRLRLDSNTLVTFQTLYSDAQGEFTEITLNDGNIYLRLNTKFATYQVNAPDASIKAPGPARFRVGAGDGVQVAVRQGDVNVEGQNDHAHLHAGDYLDIDNPNAAYTIRDLPRADDWDKWNQARDDEIDGLRNHPSYRYLPPNIALCADDLDAYGAWRIDPVYGACWVPTVAVDWRPYYYGHWAWVEPFGWTWVSGERWGWAPYHYGTWIHLGFGWSWVPGPSVQYWSPGVVAFYQSGPRVLWCPLAPHEVIYPHTLSIGFGNGNWSAFFSIGGAAVYYPSEHGIFEPRPWRTPYVNRIGLIHDYHEGGPFVRTVNQNVFLPESHFVPANARSGGASFVPASEFGTRAGSDRAAAGVASTKFFENARGIGAPTGGVPVAGPQTVRPTPLGLAPTHSFRTDVHVPESVLSRPVFRSTLPSGAARFTAPTSQRFSNSPRSAVGEPETSGRRPDERGNHEGGTTSHSTSNGDQRGGSQHGSGLDEYLRNRGHEGGAPGRETTGRTDAGDHQSGGLDHGSRTATIGGGPEVGGTSHYSNPPVERAHGAYGSSTGSYRPLHSSSSGGHSGSSGGGGHSGRSDGGRGR